MFECSYSREPVDFRLLFLRFIRKIWILPLAALAGILLIGSIYYMSKLCFGNGRTYQTDTMFHVVFAEDSSGETYDYINFYTWGELIKTDYFVDSMYEILGGSVSKEEIVNAVYATIESDVRFLYTHCTSRSPEMSVKMERALEEAMLKFPDEMIEISDISIVRKNEESFDSSNIRLYTAGILGGVIGLLTGLFFVLITIIADTSIYIPATLEKRYHIPTLLTPSMEEYEENCKVLLSDIDNLKLITVGKVVCQPEIFKEYEAVDNPIINGDVIKKLCGASCVLSVQAAANNGKQLERTLEELGRIGAKVVAFVLTGEDVSLIKAYYRK